MNVTEQVLKNLANIKKMIPQWGKEAVIANKQEIIDLVKYGQLNKGKNSLDMALEHADGDGTYAPDTERFAEAQNVYTPKTPGMAYNFYWTGETFENMYLDSVNVNESTYDIGTVRGKQSLLESIYGEIFDLTEKHNHKVNVEIIEPFLLNKINAQMLEF